MDWQRILITGASSGLGFALAEKIASPGVTLLLSGRSEDRLVQLANLVQEKGCVAKICTADLLTSEGQQSLIDLVEEELPDLLIQCAGIGTYGRFVDTPLEKSFGIMQVNVMAIMALTHAWSRALISHSKQGKVIFISSTAAFLPIPGMAVYAASKACLSSFAEAFRFEVKRNGISVLTICPGQFSTNFQLRAAGKLLGTPSSKAAKKVAKAIIRVIDREGVYTLKPWRLLLMLRYLLPRQWFMKRLERALLSRIMGTT